MSRIPASVFVVPAWMDLPFSNRIASMIWKVPTAFVAYMIALAILVAAHAMTSGMNANTFLLCLLNAFIAATSAMGMYEKTFKKIEKTE